MKKFFSRFNFLGKNGPELNDEDLVRVRTQILNALLIVMSVFGIFAYIPNMQNDVKTQSWAILSVYSSALLWLFIITVIRRINYSVRASSLIAIVSLVGVAVLRTSGLDGDGVLFLLFAPLLSGILLDKRWAIGTAAISTTMYSVIGALMGARVIQSIDAVVTDPNSDPAAWLRTGMNFPLLSFSTAAALILIVGTLEKNLQQQRKLSASVETERAQLEQRVQERTVDLQRRIVQIRTAAETIRSISALQDIPTLLKQVVNLLQERFDLYYVGVFLIAEQKVPGEALYAQLVAGTGEAGQKMLAQGHKLAVGGDSMIGWTTSNRKARIALDVGQEAVRFSNPLLPLTRSELALPIVSGNDVLGALTVQSTRPEAFDEDDITVLQGVADSLSTAIQNAHLFEEVQSNLEEMQIMQRQYLAQAWMETAATARLQYTYEPPRLPGQEVRSQTEVQPLQVPLVLRDQVIGTITLEGEQRNWTAEEKSLIESVSTQAALALENARLLAETQRRVDQERVTTNISGKIWASTDVDAILRTSLRELGRVLRASEGLIRLDVTEPDKLDN